MTATGFIRVAGGGFLRRGHGFALNVEACKTCNRTCGHFDDFTPDCVALTFSGFQDHLTQLYSCQDGTYNVPWIDCDTHWFEKFQPEYEESSIQSCLWGVAEPCPPWGFGAFWAPEQGYSPQRLIEAHLACDTRRGRYFGLRVPGWDAMQFSYQSEYIPEMICGDFTVTLTKTAYAPEWAPETCTLVGANGATATDFATLFDEDGVYWQNVCDDCGAAEEYEVNLSGFAKVIPGPFGDPDFCDDMNGAKVVTRAPCGTSWRWNNAFFSITFEIAAGKLQLGLYEWPSGDPIANFEASISGLIPCKTLSGVGLNHVWGTKCNAAAATVTVSA